MSPLPFNLHLIQFLADHRTAPLTKFFLAVTSLGTFNIYILVVTLIYVAWNKQLAIRLAVLMLLTSTLNGLLKLTIRNPRPFVREGTYLKHWAVSPRDAALLAGEYSTPSGHATPWRRPPSMPISIAAPATLTSESLPSPPLFL